MPKEVVMFEFEKKFFHDPTTYDEIERFGSIYQPHELIIIYSGFDENQIKEIIQFTRINTKTVHLISTLNKENIHSEMVRDNRTAMMQQKSFARVL